MKILLVIDQYYAANNGMTISTRRFAEVLRKHGHEVRVISTGCAEDVTIPNSAYLLDKQYIPIFDKLISSQGMAFAKPNEKILKEAISWADIVHILVPFALSHKAIKIAKQVNVPFTGAFHVQPENITSSLHMGKVEFLNRWIYHWFHHYIYQYCSHIHCPSNFIANEMKRNGYQQKLHVISNGIDPDFIYKKINKSKELSDKFVILMIGRLSIEKRQDVLIKAIAKSKYKDQIQLVLAGKGPRKEYLQNLSNKLKVPTKYCFLSKEDLLTMIAMSDLYVHASDMEIEAMSCMEAFACGLVPIIANSHKSATPQFALDERSLFKAGDSNDLAKKIDYWIEHENERKEMEYKYSEHAKKYNLESCVMKIEDMFCMAINEKKEK